MVHMRDSLWAPGFLVARGDCASRPHGSYLIKHTPLRLRETAVSPNTFRQTESRLNEETKEHIPKPNMLERSTYGKLGSKTSLVKNTHNCIKLKEFWKLQRNLRALMVCAVWKWCYFFLCLWGYYPASLISIHSAIGLTIAFAPHSPRPHHTHTVIGSGWTHDIKSSNQVYWHSQKKVFLWISSFQNVRLKIL